MQGNKKGLQAWKQYVNSLASTQWSDEPYEYVDIHLKLVYLYDDKSGPVPDVDNIIKPIQDSLENIVYIDDAWITDVEAHKRPLAGNYDLGKEPYLTLLDSINDTQECVYLELRQALDLEDYWL